jgi:hypothetical protein
VEPQLEPGDAQFGNNPGKKDGIFQTMAAGSAGIGHLFDSGAA